MIFLYKKFILHLLESSKISQLECKPSRKWRDHDNLVPYRKYAQFISINVQLHLNDQIDLFLALMVI